MPHILAIDSGGAKCDALIARADGTVLGRAICQRLGLGGRSDEAIAEAVVTALRAARLRNPQFHLASYGRALPAALLQTHHIKILSTHVTTEYDAAFLLANVRFGIVALAGTGAFVHARLTDGRQLHRDGLGPLLGDYGGGFFIGREALRAAVRSDWSPRCRTSLRESVFAAYGAKKTDDLIPLNWTVQDRSEIARLAPLVDAAAREGDRIARRILETAADALGETLRDTLSALGVVKEKYPLIGTGSVIARSDIFWKRFCHRARKFAPRLTPLRLTAPLIAGIALASPALESPQKFRRRAARL